MTAALLELGPFVVRPALLLAAAALVAALLSRASAAARHLVWSAGLAGALVLPLATAVLPRVPVPAPRALAGIVDRPGTPRLSEDAPAAVALSPATFSGMAPSPSLGDRILILWLCGSLGVLGLLAAHAIGLRLRERHWAEVGDPTLLALLDIARRRMGVTRGVGLLRAEPGIVPMTWGLRHPRIVLPGDVSGWPAERVRLVLMHELAHVRRRDVLLRAIAGLACAVHWFNPLAWYAARRIALESEQASDDLVLLAGAAPADYARALVDLTQSARAARAPARAALAMAGRSALGGRLRAVLDRARVRGIASPWAVTWTTAVAAALVAVVGTVQPTAATSPARPAQPGTMARESPPDAMRSGCWERLGPGVDSNRDRSDGRQTAAWRTSRCSGSVVFEGRPVVDRDTTRLIGVAGGIRIVEREGEVERLIVGTGGAAPSLSGAVDGRSVSASTAERWTAESLRPLLRLTGLDVAVAPR